jgi:hypothetical protein
MANASIQFTQGANIGGTGQSVLGFVRGSSVTMTDAGGPGATYQWTIASYPSPLSSAPAITGATSQVATCNPLQDGVYIVRLVRTEGATVTVDVRFFGVGDEDGLILPSPGQSGNMHNTGPSPLLAIEAGWAGRADASSNDQLDAYLRFMKSRVGRWVGNPQTINFTSGSTTTVPYVDGTDKPYRILNLTGSGLYTEELDVALSAGKSVSYYVTISAGSGGFVLHNGIGGGSIFAVSAPASGQATYGFTATYTGAAWVVSSASAISGPSGQVAQTDGAKVFFGSISNANISATAAIDGTKINPNFGSQSVQTTGAVSGNTLLATTSLTAASARITGLGTGSFVKTDGTSTLTSQVGIQLSDLTTAGQTRGDVAFFNGSSWVRLAAGVSGQLLQTQGSAADPQWTTFSSTPSGSAGGDLSGSYPNPTVAQINGASVPAAGSLTTSAVLMVTGLAALGYALLANANISATAAIAGTKISPDFGAQDVQTTGAIYGSRVVVATGPTISKGTGVPSTSEPNGSLFMRTDGTDGSSALYTRQGGAWFALGGGADFGSQNITTTGNVSATIATFSKILYATGSTPQWANVQQISVAVSDHTLSAAEYGHPIIEAVGGIPADRTMIFPLINANTLSTNGTIWHIRNATTGGFNVNVRGPSGAIVQVPFGGSAIVYTDGVNFYSLGASGSGGGSSGAAGGDLSGNYPNPQVAFLTGVGGIVKAVASYFAIDASITTNYTFVPDQATSSAGDGFKYVFQGQHGKIASGAGVGGGVQIVGGNAGNSTSLGGGLEILLGNNSYDSTKGGYVYVRQHAGISGVLQTWVDSSTNPIASVVDSGLNIASGKKLYMGGTGTNPVVLTSIPTLTAGSGDPTANEPTGSIYLKNDAAATYSVFWVRQGTTWASLGQPSGSAGGDLSGTYPSPTVAKINGTTISTAGGALTTNTVLIVTGVASAAYGYIADANVYAFAAIAGSKITPNFGSQVLTAGALTVGPSGPTIKKGTGVPSSATEPQGSIYIRTDGDDGSNGLYTYQSSAWYAVGAGAGGPPTGPASGDLSSSYPSPTVAKINGTTLTGGAYNNYVLIGTGVNTAGWGTLADANISGGAAIAGSKITPNFGSQTLTAGVLTLTASGPTITKGAGVPSSAAPAGSLFMRTDGTIGADALYSYQAGAWVAVGTGGGATPTGPASGDLSASYPNPTVSKINGISVPGSAPAAGNFIRASSTSALAYVTIGTGDLPNFPGGDLTNTYANPQVVGLTGVAGVTTIHGGTLRWDPTLTPLITQTAPTSDYSAHDLSLTSQAPYASAVTNLSPGNIVLTVPSGVGGSPPSGKVSFSISGSERAYIGLDALVLGSSTKLYLGSTTLPAIFSGVGAPGATTAPDGSLYLVRGSTGASTTAYVRASGAWSPLNVGGATAASSVSYLDTNTPIFGAVDVQGVFDAIKSLSAPGGTRLSTMTYAAAYGVSGAQTAGSTSFAGVGLIRFNPNHYFPAIDGGATKRIKFKAYLESTGGLTSEIRLYDLTGASVVASSTLSTASSTPVLLASVDISGNLAAAVEHDYEVQIRMTGSPTSGDRVTCKMAQLEVTYV